MKHYNKNNYTLIKKRILKAKLRRAIFLTICIALVLVIFFCAYILINFFTASSSQNGRKLTIGEREVIIPEYVDIQLLPIGNARKGLPLKKVNSIVVHYVGNPGTSAQNNRNYFAKHSTTVCSHFVIGLDGEIIQCVPLDERSAASNHRNKDTISIEVCHPDTSGKFNRKTYDSLIKLTAFLCESFELDEKDIIRHYDVTGKLCPLYYVENPDEWQNFIIDVKQQLQDVK